MSANQADFHGYLAKDGDRLCLSISKILLGSYAYFRHFPRNTGIIEVFSVKVILKYRNFHSKLLPAAAGGCPFWGAAWMFQ